MNSLTDDVKRAYVATAFHLCMKIYLFNLVKIKLTLSNDLYFDSRLSSDLVTTLTQLKCTVWFSIVFVFDYF